MPDEYSTFYYKVLDDEAIDIIEYVIDNDNFTPSQSFAIGNALKYLLRLGRKNSVIESELYKAENYIHRARTGKWIDKGDVL